MAEVKFSGGVDMLCPSLADGYLMRIVHTSEDFFKKLHEQGIDIVARMYIKQDSVDGQSFARDIGILPLIPEPNESDLHFNPEVIDELHERINRHLSYKEEEFMDSDLITLVKKYGNYSADVYRPTESIEKQRWLYPLEYVGVAFLHLKPSQKKDLHTINLQINDRISELTLRAISKAIKPRSPTKID